MYCRTRTRHGAVALMVVLCLTVIMGIAAICLDGGLLLDQRRHVQSVADAAALAAASDLYSNYRTNGGADINSTARASALATALANGCANDGKKSTVTVNIPPTSGLFVNQPGYAEVIVHTNVTRGFSSIFGTQAIPVGARAVARGRWTPFKAGILVLAPTGNTLSGVGNATAVSGGPVVINSTDSAAVTGSGNVSMTAPEFDISGAVSPNPAYFHGTVNTNVRRTPDPLSYLPPPSTSGLARFAGGKYNDTTTLSPGIYTNGIQISGPGTVTLNPGIYYLESGGLSMTGQASLAGNGVLIYNAGSRSSIDLQGTGSVTLSPMQTGLYEGIVIYQDRASTAPMSISGNGNMNITGSFYASAASVRIKGNGGTNVIGSQYIVHDLAMTGNGSIEVTLTNDTSAKSRILGLVE